MTDIELIEAIILFILAGINVFISIRQFAEKGFLFNNAYLFASKEERQKMDKRPYYHQSAIVFALVGAVFVVRGLSIILQNIYVEFIQIPLILGIIVYGIISSIRIEMHIKK